MSKKSWPNLDSDLQCKMAQDFLGIQCVSSDIAKVIYYSRQYNSFSKKKITDEYEAIIKSFLKQIPENFLVSAFSGNKARGLDNWL